LFASRAEFVALAILSPVIWLRLCCSVALTIFVVGDLAVGRRCR